MFKFGRREGEIGHRNVFRGTFRNCKYENGIPKLVFADGISFANVGGKVKEHVLHIITKSTAREVYESIKVSSDSSNSDSSLEEFMMRFRGEYNCR